MQRLFVPLLLLSSTGVASATAISVLNPGFESVTLANPGDYSSTNIPGWVTNINSSTFRPQTSDYPGGIPEGLNVAAVTNGDLTYQTLSATLTADTTYTLLVDVGNRPGFFHCYTVSLSAGSAVLVSDSSLSPAAGTFLTTTLSYYAAPGNADLGQALKITLGDSGVSGQVNYDNVRLDAVTGPEPASFVSFGSGIAALFMFRRRVLMR